MYDSVEQELEWGDIKVKGLIILKCSLHLFEMQAEYSIKHDTALEMKSCEQSQLCTRSRTVNWVEHDSL